MKINPDQQKFAMEMARTGVKPDLIASAMTRRFAVTFTAVQIQALLGVNKDRTEIQKQRDDVAKQLSSHDGELRYLRDRLREEFDKPDASVHQKIELAKEIRQNITSVQRMATMKDEKGEFNVILMINDSSLDKEEAVEAEIL